MLGVEILPFNNACIGKNEIQPVAAGDKDGLERGAQLPVLIDICFMECGVCQRARSLFPALLIQIQDVNAPVASISEGTGNSQAHATCYIRLISVAIAGSHDRDTRTAACDECDFSHIDS